MLVINLRGLLEVSVQIKTLKGNIPCILSSEIGLTFGIYLPRLV